MEQIDGSVNGVPARNTMGQGRPCAAKKSRGSRSGKPSPRSPATARRAGVIQVSAAQPSQKRCIRLVLHAGVGAQCLRPVRRSRTLPLLRLRRCSEPYGIVARRSHGASKQTPIACKHRTVALRATGRKHCAPTPSGDRNLAGQIASIIPFPVITLCLAIWCRGAMLAPIAAEPQEATGSRGAVRHRAQALRPTSGHVR